MVDELITGCTAGQTFAVGTPTASPDLVRMFRILQGRLKVWFHETWLFLDVENSLPYFLFPPAYLALVLVRQVRTHPHPSSDNQHRCSGRKLNLQEKVADFLPSQWQSP